MLHGVVEELGDIQAGQLAAAAEVLGVPTLQLLGYPDGHVADKPTHELAIPVIRLAEQSGAPGVLVFDPTGVTGHPDHRQATAASLAATPKVGPLVLGRTLPTTVADTLNTEDDTSFIGHQHADIDLIVPFDPGTAIRGGTPSSQPGRCQPACCGDASSRSPHCSDAPPRAWAPSRSSSSTDRRETAHRSKV